MGDHVTALLFVIVAIGGGLVRWQATRWNSGPFPMGTFAVNVTAAFLAGLAAGLSEAAALVVTTAYLGSMSTFSTITGEVVDRLVDRRRTAAFTYLAATIVGGVGAAWIGLTL